MLNLKNISKKFQKQVVLEDINLAINRAEIVSLLGQSGSGKSTLLNIIAGFETADKGSCIYQGKTIFDSSCFVEPQNRDIGFVFQDNALFPHLNVAKNISFGISHQNRTTQKHIVTELLELINMQDARDKFPHQLSGGQQQRVAIARVLARDSELILFDEPFSSIDSTLKLNMIEEIRNIIKSKNKTAIFVTHCPREAILLSDRIAYIEDNKIVQFDTPENLISNPTTASISSLFGEESFMFGNISKPSK